MIISSGWQFSRNVRKRSILIYTSSYPLLFLWVMYNLWCFSSHSAYCKQLRCGPAYHVQKDFKCWISACFFGFCSNACPCHCILADTYRIFHQGLENALFFFFLICIFNFQYVYQLTNVCNFHRWSCGETGSNFGGRPS